MFQYTIHVSSCSLIHSALEAHSVIEKGRNKELWNEEYRKTSGEDRDDSLHYKAVK